MGCSIYWGFFVCIASLKKFIIKNIINEIDLYIKQELFIYNYNLSYDKFVILTGETLFNKYLIFIESVKKIFYIIFNNFH